MASAGKKKKRKNTPKNTPSSAQVKASSKRMAPPSCPKCGGKKSIRSGMVAGQQRWKCKPCDYQYTRLSPRGRPIWQKSLVVFLYSYGVSMHAIAHIFHVQPSTVLKWVRTYAKDYRPTTESGDISMADLSDVQRYLKKVSTHKSGQKSGTLCIAIGDATFRKNLGITITQR